jgi:phage terminase small subunit
MVLEYGPVIFKKDEAGNPVDFKRNPACLDAKELSALCIQLEREFGLTPSARSNISAARDESQKGGLEDFFSGG